MAAYGIPPLPDLSRICARATARGPRFAREPPGVAHVTLGDPAAPS